MNWKVEAEAKEAHDNQIDQSDRDRRDDLVGVERPQIELTESNRRAQCLRNAYCVCDHTGVRRRVLQHLLGKFLTDHGGSLGHKHLHLRADEIVPIGVIAGILINELTGAKGIVGGVSARDCRL